ncbi:SDR family oxidoreductase [Glaciibacter sp. 2TAF33]|uniref:SDR family oxidoreductase n=1 Tax=Glaciibacter sp. 2TAF33 TaxID=3233015 RepID=UPI003F8F409D
MILIAGAGGRLGTLVVSDLAAGGHPLRVIVRDASRYRPPAGAKVDVVVGDVTDAAAVDRAMTGASVVISAVHGLIGRGSHSIHETDVVGNQNLIVAAQRAQVGRFVLLSVHGASATSPMELTRAKFAAERALAGSGLAFTVIRPTAYLETWLDVVAAGRAGTARPRILGNGTNPINFVSVRDVAALVVGEALATTAGNRVYEIGGPANLALGELARELVAAGVCAGRSRRIPRRALRAASIVARPFKPAAARLASAAYLMDTIPMATGEGDARARVPGVPLTTFEHALRALDTLHSSQV